MHLELNLIRHSKCFIKKKKNHTYGSLLKLVVSNGRRYLLDVLGYTEHLSPLGYTEHLPPLLSLLMDEFTSLHHTLLTLLPPWSLCNVS